MPVVNIKTSTAEFVYVGRPGHGYAGYFGNPIENGTICTVCGAFHTFPGDTIDCFEVYARRRIETDPVYKERLKDLHEMTLGCFCWPKRCHADILLKLAAELQ